MSGEEAWIRAFAASVIELEAPAAVKADVQGFLAGHGVPAEALVALPEAAAERLAIYRTMVHGRLRGAVEDFLPNTATRLGRLRLRLEIAQFVAEAAPVAPYFWRVTGEFLRWARPRWAVDTTLPDYLLELALHEWSDAELGNLPAGGEAASGKPLALDGPVQFDGTVRLRRYRWAVHRASATEAPPAEATALLQYRDRSDHQVKTLELTPRAAAVTERLLAGEPLQGALQGACAELGVALDDELLAAMAGYFADLAERGALLGAA
ncbi:HvfC family peptide modification chaperone [Nannocystis bainbridge]|uniref:DNA-binding domain-containing protein n=1 Tax=Nannocystis bainbridge TaxID=2995303 RepID=A0ABT5E8H8_9BACT|nr:putative DNA-binding domain-containing protein [Nannocystis bainbridge]MDC0722164.1 putative DNA-binding domain-containing protein [Nannocystis bainbridge]